MQMPQEQPWGGATSSVPPRDSCFTERNRPARKLFGRLVCVWLPERACEAATIRGGN